MLFELDEKTFEDYVKNDKGRILVECFAPSCRQCQTIETILEDLSDELYGTLKIFKLNVEVCAAIADQYDVLSLPTLLLFEHGKLIKTMTGLQSMKVIRKWLD